MSETTDKGNIVTLIADRRTADWARGYLDRGWAPVPIRKGSKTPRPKNWGTFNTTAETVENDFRDSDNIGVILGARSGGLVDVDLDCAEAIELAPSFLPLTRAVFGRKSKPQSHYLYRARGNTEASAAVQHKASNGTMIVELRIGGGDKAAQTVMPGSTHPQGEAIRWDEAGEPTEIDYANIKTAVCRLAVGVVVLRHYPVKGLRARHSAAQTLGGFLSRVGWNADEVAAFMEAVARAADDDEVDDRRRAAFDAAQAHERGDRSFGLPKMIEMFGEEATKTIAGWLAYGENDTAEIIEEMNNRYCAIQIGGKFRILTFDDQHTPTFFRIDDFKNFHMNQLVPVSDAQGKTRWVPKGQWWLTHRDRRQYDGLIYQPGEGSEIKGQLNLWRGWGVEPRKGDWRRLRAHIREVLSADNEKVDDYIIKWCAWTFQHPAEPAEVAVVCRGGKGAGKGLLGRTLCEIFATHGRQISRMEDITHRFNVWQMYCSLLFLDEAYWPGYKNVEGQIQRMITERKLNVEPKNVDMFEVANHLHIFMAANADWVVPASLDERRYMVSNVSSHRRGDRSYFEALYGEMENGGRGAMLHDLLTLDLGDWHPRYGVPQTVALAEQKMMSLPPFDQWWLELLRDGYLPGVDPEDENKRRVTWQFCFPKSEIRFRSSNSLATMNSEVSCPVVAVRERKTGKAP